MLATESTESTDPRTRPGIVFSPTPNSSKRNGDGRGNISPGLGGVSVDSVFSVAISYARNKKLRHALD